MSRHYPSSMRDAKAAARDKLSELRSMPDPKLPKSEVEKAEPLSKPYASEAQRRWAHTEKGKKALGGADKVREWDKESKGKKLPARVAKAKIDEGKPLEAKISARTSRGEQMERGVHPSLKYGGKGMKGTSIAGGYLEEGAKGDAKRWHRQVAEESKAMKAPKLPKSEMAKEEKEKGVHTRLDGSSRRHGYSDAGSHLRSGSMMGKKVGKEMHREKLRELRSMPDPKLPKSEIIKADLRKTFEPRFCKRKKD